jgi:transposase
MRFVAVKSQAHQDMLAPHRVRSLSACERTASMNQRHILLAEYGNVVASRTTLSHIARSTLGAPGPGGSHL